MGEAYAYFNGTYSKSDLEKELPNVRKLVETPNELEAIVTEDPENHKHSINQYCIKARHPQLSNGRTADELANMVNGLYSSRLYKKGEKFFGNIEYEENGSMKLRE